MSTATALAVVPAENPQDREPFTQAQLNLIKTTIAPGVDNDQLALFVEVARRTGLDPFSRQIYAVLRNGKSQKHEDGTWTTPKVMTIQTGIDGYRAIAARTGLLAGIDDATYDTEDADQPGRASVTVWRFAHGQRVPFTATARWREYVQMVDVYQDGKKTGSKRPGDMWERMPYLMLGKCAEALALRKAFPVEISGVYTADEMAQAESEIVSAPSVEQQHSATLADCGEYAKDHDIPANIFKLATKKYAGRWDDLLAAMRSYVATRDADAAARAANEAAEAQESQDGAGLDELPVGARGN